MGRHPVKHARTLKERMSLEAQRLREEAAALPPGREREEMLRKARRAEVGANIDQWLASPGLQPPRADP
jgi:hypothetical protein